MSLLDVTGVTKRYSGLTAVDDVTFGVEDRTVVALIGPNGAGKSTLFNLVTRHVPLTAGSIAFDGRDVTALMPHQVARLGIARTFQNLRLFQGLTVVENVLAGCAARSQPRFLDPVRPSRRRYTGLREKARELLAFVGLERTPEDTLAGSLPYGRQRLLEIARALAAEPRLIMLDEPAAGLNPVEKEQLLGLIRQIRDAGTAVVLVEHNIEMIMDISDRIVVLNFGQKIADGTPDEVRADPAVVRAYLGDGTDDVA